MLQNDHPSPIGIGDVVYLSVEHAYWALSTADADVRDRIRRAWNIFTARELAEKASRVENWPQVRTAVMAGLMRAKCQQHPELAEVLIGTRDAPIAYTGTGSHHWVTGGGDGRNWVGRLLELVRSELQARNGNFLAPGTRPPLG